MLKKDLERHRNIWNDLSPSVQMYNHGLRLMQRGIEMDLQEVYWATRTAHSDDLQRIFGAHPEWKKLDREL